MKKFLLFQAGWLFIALCFLMPILSSAQVGDCGTRFTGTTDPLTGYNCSTCDAAPSCKGGTVRLFFHFIRRSNGSGGQPVSQITPMLNLVNATYQPQGLVFVSEGSDEIRNDDFFNFPVAASQDDFFNRLNAVYATNARSNAIDVYIMGVNAANFGYTETIPPYRTARINGAAQTIVSKALVMANDAILLSTFPHEMGHCLGLFHTHEREAFGIELVRRPGNCATAGDLVCDTPADFNLNKSTEFVNSSCSYIGDRRDTEGVLYTPDTRNIMSYSLDNCRVTFSAGQATRVTTALQSSPVLKPVFTPATCAANCTLPTNTCYTIQVVKTGKRLQAMDDNSIQQQNANNQNNQIWKVNSQDGGRVSFVAQNGTDRVVQAANGGNYGETLQLAGASGSDLQKWAVACDPANSSQWRVYNVANNNTWDLRDYADDPYLQIWGSTSEPFVPYRSFNFQSATCPVVTPPTTPTPVSNCTLPTNTCYKIQVVQTGKLLQKMGDNTIQQQNANNQNNQVWRITGSSNSQLLFTAQDGDFGAIQAPNGGNYGETLSATGGTQTWGVQCDPNNGSQWRIYRPGSNNTWDLRDFGNQPYLQIWGNTSEGFVPYRSFSFLSATCPTGPYIDPVATCSVGSPTGWLDVATCTYVAGWALDQSDFAKTVTVDVFVDGAKVASVQANGDRQDLPAAFGGNQAARYHGYFYALPTNAAWRDGQNHTVTARICGATSDLAGSPKTIGGCYNGARLSVVEPESVQQLLITPNPASGVVSAQFNLPEGTPGRLRVVSLLGTVLSELPVTGTGGPQTQSVDVSKYAAGVYMVNLQTERGNQTVRMLIKP